MKTKPDNKYIFLAAHMEDYSDLNIEFGMLALSTNETLTSQGQGTPDQLIREIEDLKLAVINYHLTQARRENMSVVWDDFYGTERIEDDVLIMDDYSSFWWEAMSLGGSRVWTSKLQLPKLLEFMKDEESVMLVHPPVYGEGERNSLLHSIRQWLEAKARGVVEEFVAPEGVDQEVAQQALLDEVTDIDNLGDSNPVVSAESRMNKEAVLAYLAWLEINDKP